VRLPLNAPAIIGCVVAAAATASSMFYGVVYDPLIGGVVGVICAMGVLVIAGLRRSPEVTRVCFPEVTRV
jgi:hypothetical protein